MKSIKAVAKSLNQEATKHDFGKFQQVRSQLRGRSSARSVIFDIKNKSVNEEEGWAYHTGGREELQFNIGFEEQPSRFRYGVAFSLEPSRSFTTIEPLLPKIERFNEFVRLNSGLLANYRMWVFRHNSIIKQDTAVRAITDDEIKKPNFIFLGQSGSVDDIDPQVVLDCFQDLLQLYCFVEAESAVKLRQIEKIRGVLPFSFQERLSIGGKAAVSEQPKKSVSIILRSNEIKGRLCEILVAAKAGKLGDEIPSGSGGRIDLVCLLPSGEHDYYEIKPASLARYAIREALPQLLEYAYREGGHQARRLVIASQAPLDSASRVFLETLRAKGLPIHYEHVALG